MGEPGAASPETGLHLVDHEQHAALVAQPPHPGEILGGGRIHAALALDRLEEYRRDGRVDRRGERVEVFPRDVAESLRQRLERLVLRRLAGRVQRRERAPGSPWSRSIGSTRTGAPTLVSIRAIAAATSGCAWPSDVTANPLSRSR